ncbi:MAG: hypothetical protein HYS15_01220, partial [Candidatus Spechtbacteria bacterium]|nr:hypothetical protein [Candidatus Spechtbacteria bacterium]
MQKSESLLKSKNFYFLISLFPFSFFIFHFGTADAAVLYLEPREATHYVGDTFLVEIRLNTEGEYINAAQIGVVFPDDALEIADFSKGNSVLTLWAEEPSWKNGVASFVGGTPAGYQGWDGILGKIVFRAKGSADLANIKFSDSSKALLNDGSGTQATLKVKNAAFTILKETGKASEDQWESDIAKDNISPEAFDVEIRKEAGLYNGKYFLAFSTVDKQTGIDHYEVTEFLDGGVFENMDAKSPYLLENQKLDGTIKVRAV